MRSLNKLNPARWYRRLPRKDNINTESPILDRAAIMDLLQRTESLAGNGETAKEVAYRLLGDIRSIYKGGGMDYEESRPYQAGDELRQMDWRVTARSNAHYVKVFREEKRPGVFILADRRSSMRFGTRDRLKVTQAARAASLIAFMARKVNAPVSGVALQENPQWMEQSNTEPGIFHLIHAIAKPCPPIHKQVKEPSLLYTLKLLQTMCVQGETVYLISDFIDLEEQCKSVLMQLAAQHDIKALHIVDPAELKLPNAGKLRMFSADASLSQNLDTSHPVNRATYEHAVQARLAEIKSLFESLNIPYTRLMSNDQNIENAIFI